MFLSLKSESLCQYNRISQHVFKKTAILMVLYQIKYTLKSFVIIFCYFGDGSFLKLQLHVIKRKSQQFLLYCVFYVPQIFKILFLTGDINFFCRSLCRSVLYFLTKSIFPAKETPALEFESHFCREAVKILRHEVLMEISIAGKSSAKLFVLKNGTAVLIGMQKICDIFSFRCDQLNDKRSSKQ